MGMMLCPYNCMEKVFLDHIFIMTAYNFFKVRKRTVTNLDIIKVERFVKLICFWEMFAQ